MSDRPLTRLPQNIDIHAHSGLPRADAVVCVDPVDSECLPEGSGWLSVGVHPWNADRADAAVWERMERWLADPRVVAVGEVGLDALRGPEPSEQMAVLERQIEMAERHGVPLVIHCVRCFDKLLRLRKNRPTSGQWIVHGFRGKPALARQLLEAGIDLSFGDRYNPESYNITPSERRYRETDR